MMGWLHCSLSFSLLCSTICERDSYSSAASFGRPALTSSVELVYCNRGFKHLKPFTNVVLWSWFKWINLVRQGNCTCMEQWTRTNAH